jgi:hypothetical protein
MKEDEMGRGHGEARREYRVSVGSLQHLAELNLELTN